MLEVAGLRKRYGPFVAVKNVSFQVNRGEVYGLLGPNGAGKSSTIKVISGLAQPDDGEVRVDGLSIKREGPEVKRRVGIVPQEIALYDDFTALENLVFFGQLYGHGGRSLRERARGLLAEVGLADRANERVGGFSGGMKRRVNIAAGLVHDPLLLLLDEPTVGIDPQSRRNVLDFVKSLGQRGLTVLYTTHYMEEAEALCDRIGIIDHGEIIAEGGLADLRRLAGELTPIRITLRGTPSPEQMAELKTLVETVSLDGDELALLAKEPRLALPRVLSLLALGGVGVHHLEINEPDLEAVFLRLTGRRLRD